MLGRFGVLCNECHVNVCFEDAMDESQRDFEDKEITGHMFVLTKAFSSSLTFHPSSTPLLLS